MSLVINLAPEIERGLLAKAQAEGVSPSDFVESIIVRALKSGDAPAGIEARNLVELFDASPFQGLGMTFEREKDYGRKIEL